MKSIMIEKNFSRVTRSVKIQVVSQFRDGLKMNKFTCFFNA